METNKIYQGDSLEVLGGFPDMKHLTTDLKK